jgi:hypothetical protein
MAVPYCQVCWGSSDFEIERKLQDASNLMTPNSCADTIACPVCVVGTRFSIGGSQLSSASLVEDML